MRYIIVHGHIFKNAGSTFDDALFRAFDDRFIDHRDDAAMRSGGAKYLNKFILANPQMCALSSHHLCNPLPISDDYICLPVYFVRHPIERIISVYSFERTQNAETPGAIAAAKYSLLDYIKWRFDTDRHLVISNYQVAYIGAQYEVTAQKPVGLKELKSCIAKHKQGHCFLGVVDEFGKSFNMFCNYIKEYFPEVNFTYTIQNVTSSASFDEKIRAAVEQLEPMIDILYCMNTYDLALYNYIKAIYSIDDTLSVEEITPENMPELPDNQVEVGEISISTTHVDVTN